MKNKKMNVLVIGLGLIGGSFAAALKKNLLQWHVVGYDMDKSVATSCMEKGFVDRLTNKRALDNEINKADLVILALPILSIIKIVESNKHNFKNGGIIIDVGSTKNKIVNKMNELPGNINTIGGHPMTGKVTAGVDGPSPILFENKIFILTPSKNTNLKTLEFATKLVKSIGGLPLNIDPEKHDFLVAMVSHLPYLIPALLVNTTNKIKDDIIWQIAAGGYKSIAENAGHNIPMWEDILNTNDKSILNALDLFEEEIKELKKLLIRNNKSELKNYLKETLKVKKKLKG